MADPIFSNNPPIQAGGSSWWDQFTSGFKENVLAPGSVGNWFLDPLDLTGQRAAQTQYFSQLGLQQQQQAYNSAEAEKQRKWEAEMSNSAVQRQVADIKAAGLNPWLALNGGQAGGASTPSGSSASSSAGNTVAPNNKMAMVAAVIATALRYFLTKGK